jgi:hypothetical protein
MGSARQTSKSLLDTFHKLSEDFTHLKCHNASLKSQINKLHGKLYQPQESVFSRIGLQANMEILHSTKAAPCWNPARNDAAVTIIGSSYIASHSKEYSEREFASDSASAVPSPKVSTMQED